MFLSKCRYLPLQWDQKSNCMTGCHGNVCSLCLMSITKRYVNVQNVNVCMYTVTLFCTLCNTVYVHVPFFVVVALRL